MTSLALTLAAWALFVPLVVFTIRNLALGGDPYVRSFRRALSRERGRA